MLHKKLNIALVLMAITFLVIFLGYWIRKSYFEEVEGLKNELEVSLSKVNQELKDSQLKNIFMFITDTLENGEIDNIRESITVRDYSGDIHKTYNTKSSAHTITSGQVKIMIDAKENDVSKFKLRRNVEFQEKGDSTEIVDLFAFNREDINELDSAWRVKLSETELPKQFIIREKKEGELSDSLHILVREKDFFSANEYLATFSEYNGYIIKRIAPQLTVSFLLLSTFLTAFYFIFKSLNEQEKLAKLRNDFISNMTHELKTPISTVGVAIEALQNFDALSSPEKTKEYLGIAGNELNRLSILVDKVLKMSQFDTNKSPMGKVTVNDFKEILKNVSTSMKLQLEKYDASLELMIDDGNYSVQGDKVHLANIIYNLLDNALKYGGNKPSIQVQLVNTMDNIFLTVKDHGMGIAKEYQNKIFDQFFRIPKGNLHKVKGYGLGLSYVANVVRAHGGKITLSSEKNHGSEFVIELPKYA